VGFRGVTWRAVAHPALPPNQILTRRWPAIGEREPEPFDAATWRLSVTGLLRNELALRFAELAAMPQTERRGTLHCVTRWSRPDTAFRGVHVAEVLAAAIPDPAARFVRFASGRGHDTSLPIGACGDTLIALEYEHDGRFVPVPAEHGGPVRTVVFDRYLYKSVKWLRSIECLAEDRLGFWERTAGYHNEADPWREQRYVTRDVDRVTLAKRMAARDLAGLDLLGADFAGADLARFDLRGASLRNVSLRRASLRDADLTGANCTNAVLAGADLRGARIDRIDLDGADVRGADLRDATGVPASLAVTEFVSGATDGARVDGLDWRTAQVAGLLPEQEDYLRRAGVRLR
jgi:DMSO/TMAO reductase YedYZ molybdopterin-dependent catalytic subunit